MISADQAKELFTYNSGNLFWNNSKSLKAKKGKKAGYTDPRTGYGHVRINYKMYPLHKLIYLYHHGEYPQIVDHIDRDKRNNQIENLRKCSKSQNEANTSARKTNKLGEKHICVSFGAYAVSIYRQGKSIRKRFKTLEKAIEFRDSVLDNIDRDFFYKCQK